VLRERYPAVALVVLTVFDDDEQIFNALCAGTSGLAQRNAACEAARKYSGSGCGRRADVTRDRAASCGLVPDSPAARATDCNLAPHELRILKLLVDGHSYKSAATELGIAFHTVAFHVQNTYQKLQVHSKSEAVVKALRSRLTR